MNASQANTLKVGWASTELTPDQPVLILGQFHARVSEGVVDPLSATAMALESLGPAGEPARSVMVSCDLAVISDDLLNAVRQRVRDAVPEIDPAHVVLNATHTHTAPQVRLTQMDGCVPSACGLTTEELGIMPPEAYIALAADRIADAIARAWHGREPAGIGFGLGHATVGYNRRICYHTGETRMYGGVNKPEFSHIEGATDTSINILCTWNHREQLTGVVVNIACPSQVSEQEYRLSADYWHETRLALRQRLGEDVFILPQCSAAGDIVPAKGSRTVPDWKALERMWQRQSLTQRQDIARRIADAVTPVVQGVGREIDWHPVMSHRVENVPLPWRKISEQDVEEALADAEQWQSKYEALRRELQENPSKRHEPRWYVPISKAYRRIHWQRSVAARYERQQDEPTVPAETHVLRLGAVVFATNRFEYYLDFGLQIKARSTATQTFIVQLAGPGTYLPTPRAAAGRSYGAVPASTLVDPEGGHVLVERTVAAIDELLPQEPTEAATRSDTAHAT